MFAYCLNNPILGIDSSGKRTYFINGINNEDESGSPSYAEKFAQSLTDLGISDVRTVPAYNGQKGFFGILRGVIEVIGEMVNLQIYSQRIAQTILDDLENDPLAEGEQLNLIGYSGGGQLALNVMEILNGKVDNVILIGAPIAECWNSATTVSMIYAGWDPLSWNVGFGYDTYFAGWIGHTDYFNSDNIENVATMVGNLIN